MENFHYLDRFKGNEVVQKSSVLQNKTYFDRSSYDTYCGYFISFKIYLNGISYLSELKVTVFGQKKDNKIVLDREFEF